MIQIKIHCTAIERMIEYREIFYPLKVITVYNLLYALKYRCQHCVDIVVMMIDFICKCNGCGGRRTSIRSENNDFYLRSAGLICKRNKLIVTIRGAIAAHSFIFILLLID